jgi:uncharacterized membrane protein YGL010W
MDPTAGGLGAILVFIVYLGSSKLVIDETVVFGGFPIWQAALTIHLTGWLLQFIGHGVFEGKFNEITLNFTFVSETKRLFSNLGRAPALLDSLDQALLTAPLFVLLEILFFCGYRNEFYKVCIYRLYFIIVYNDLSNSGNDVASQ